MLTIDVYSNGTEISVYRELFASSPFMYTTMAQRFWCMMKNIFSLIFFTFHQNLFWHRFFDVSNRNPLLANLAVGCIPSATSHVIPSV